jgi:hypothetical protein
LISEHNANTYTILYILALSFAFIAFYRTFRIVLLCKPQKRRGRGDGLNQRGLNTKRHMLVFFLAPTKHLQSYG